MSWGTAHLTDGAEYWERFADRLEFGFAEVHNLIRSSAWQGHAFDAAESRAASDKEKASRVGERLREAAKVSRQGASDLSAAQSRLRSAVEDAWDAGFNVYDDYMVKYAGSVKTVEEQAVRQAQAEGFAGDIRQRAAQLLGLDQRVGSEITTALGNLIGFRFDEHKPDVDGADEKSKRSGAVHAVDNKTKGQDSPEDEGQKHGGSKSFGKGSTTHIESHGDTEKQWGHPTDPHEVWPDVPHKTGTFDGDHGSWEWHGPGRQGEAYASQHTDGITGKAGVDAWGAKGEAHWSRDVFGHPLTTSANGEAGVHGNADATITDHGVSLGADGFLGGELGGKADYNLGPMDLSMGGAAQYGVGGTAHLDVGMEDGKFVLGGTLGLAWGPGAKISPHIAIDPNALVGGLAKAGQWLSDLFN
ncbi:hypothetical protein JMUB5695_02198 [Mycobacterium heckeshornense]|nr:hypothetical protein JMUB5695_02198 [Mycobacterium heckeshornense]